MKPGTIWGLSLGIGIPGALILIGLLGLLIKFFIKRCRKKAWNDISTPPKQSDSIENVLNQRKFPKRTSSDVNHYINQRLHRLNLNIPLVQIQRDRLNRLKEEENRIRPMLQLNRGELDIQSAIDQAQKEFEETVGTAASKMKRRRDK
ncbi:hypothetical protein I4U23_000708 [Adineta vaga]|nr:hypothetical protein I4U23_000708 [Adineta vaga]